MKVSGYRHLAFSTSWRETYLILNNAWQVEAFVEVNVLVAVPIGVDKIRTHLLVSCARLSVSELVRGPALDSYEKVPVPVQSQRAATDDG